MVTIMKTNFKMGKIYRIEFLDHCIGKKLLLCEVVGRVIRQNKDEVVLSYWNIIDPDGEEYKEDNHEPVAIAKSTIKRKRVLA